VLKTPKPNPLLQKPPTKSDPIAIQEPSCKTEQTNPAQVPTDIHLDSLRQSRAEAVSSAARAQEKDDYSEDFDQDPKQSEAYSEI
jgi:hypothetical protein